MALLPSVATYITVEASRYRSAVSEFLVQTIGKSVNYLLDKVDDIESQIEGTSFSEVIPTVIAFGAMPYTVPAGYSFTGTITVVISSTNEAYAIVADSGGGNFDGGSTTTTGNNTAFSHAIQSAAGTTIDATGSLANKYATGILWKSATITIP